MHDIRIVKKIDVSKDHGVKLDRLRDRLRMNFGESRKTWEDLFDYVGRLEARIAKLEQLNNG